MSRIKGTNNNNKFYTWTENLSTSYCLRVRNWGQEDLRRTVSTRRETGKKDLSHHFPSPFEVGGVRQTRSCRRKRVRTLDLFKGLGTQLYDMVETTSTLKLFPLAELGEIRNEVCGAWGLWSHIRTYTKIPKKSTRRLFHRVRFQILSFLSSPLPKSPCRQNKTGVL